MDQILAALANGTMTQLEAKQRLATLITPDGDQQPTAESYDSSGEHSGPKRAQEETSAQEEAPESHDAAQPAINLDQIAKGAETLVRDASQRARDVFNRLTAPSEPPASSQPEGTLNRLIVRSVGRRVRVEGDESVATVRVAGPHTVKRRNDVIEVATEGELNVPGVLHPPRSLNDLRDMSLGKELLIQVNPSVLVDAEVTGGKLTTHDVPHLGSIRVSAGGASLSGVTRVEDALIQAGGANLSGPICEGNSRIRVESGNLTCRLSLGSDVTIRSSAQLGHVSWPAGVSGDVDEYVVGEGLARLEIGVVMGRAVVRVDS